MRRVDNRHKMAAAAAAWLYMLNPDKMLSHSPFDASPPRDEKIIGCRTEWVFRVVTVRERQHRYLQAAHRHVYQIVDEDILPFPELYQQRDDHVEPHGGAQRRPRPTPSAQTAGEEQQEEEEDEEEEETEEEETEEEEDEEESGGAADEHEDADHHSVPNVSNHDTSS